MVSKLFHLVYYFHVSVSFRSVFYRFRCVSVPADFYVYVSVFINEFIIFPLSVISVSVNENHTCIELVHTYTARYYTAVPSIIIIIIIISSSSSTHYKLNEGAITEWNGKVNQADQRTAARQKKSPFTDITGDCELKVLTNDTNIITNDINIITAVLHSRNNELICIITNRYELKTCIGV